MIYNGASSVVVVLCKGIEANLVASPPRNSGGVFNIKYDTVT